MKYLKIRFCVLLFFINTIFIFSGDLESQDETKDLKYIISLDTGLMITAVKNIGYGIGINYEHKLRDYLSVKSGFGHMACFSEVTVVTVNLQVFFYYYPLSNGLDKFYIGIGNGCDFLMYPKEDDIPDDTAISIIPLLGWKWKAMRYLMIEPYVGWKFYIMETNNYDRTKDYLNTGFQWGINFKIYFNN